jgi:predicted MFS family arabinose efflux permease
VPTTSERTLLFLVGAVQFVNVLDFMMVMPLGPDFASALGIPASQLGLVGGAYTAAAAVAGIAASTFLDRFDRRSALAVAMMGLVVSTAAGGLATGLGSMIAARLLAGAFGGPATALALSIVADAVPVQRRGKALGAVMGAFSVASVLGVPAGLELARLGSWRTPFFAVATLGLVVAGSALKLMPSMRGHLARAAGDHRPVSSSLALLRRPAALAALGATATTMMSSFAIVPNIAAHLQLNLGFPRERLGLMYMGGGAVSFFVLRLAGRAVDRLGEPRVAALGTAVFVFVLAFGFAFPAAWFPVWALFMCFMTANSIRSVAMSNVSTRVPASHERARFMSTQSAVQHLASATGAALSTQILTVRPDGRLGGMPALAALSGALALLLPVLVLVAVRRVRQEAAARGTAVDSLQAAPAAPAS